jgi:hypothetical protein
MTPTQSRRFYYAVISRDQWLRICSLARLAGESTDHWAGAVVDRGLESYETEKRAELEHSNALWRARYRFAREQGVKL